MDPHETRIPDDDLAEILALLRYLGPDDVQRKALLPFLRVYTEHKEALALPFVGRPRKRPRRTDGLCAGIAALLAGLMPAFTAWASL